MAVCPIVPAINNAVHVKTQAMQYVYHIVQHQTFCIGHLAHRMFACCKYYFPSGPLGY